MSTAGQRLGERGFIRRPDLVTAAAHQGFMGSRCICNSSQGALNVTISEVE